MKALFKSIGNKTVTRLLAALLLAAGVATRVSGQGDNVKISKGDPFEAIYRAYAPIGWKLGDEESMKLSSEQKFFTLNLLTESDRANALVLAAKEKEREKQYVEAMEIYQKVIDEYADILYRVSEYGIFVPITYYCQLRILDFPPDALQAYRTKYDARAKDAYEMAERKNSLEGLAEVRDKMLATSYGAPAMITLGYSALDRGHFLEALEYFNTVWQHFPEMRIKNPHMASAMALCRKMLGQNITPGRLTDLVGHWKFDEGRDAVITDASGLGHDGAANAIVRWGKGKDGGAYEFTYTNDIAIPEKHSMTIGIGATDFSVQLWLNPSNVTDGVLFDKRGRSPNDKLELVLNRKGQVVYKIATDSTVWETGTTPSSLSTGRWNHVAFVKAGKEVRIFLDGRLDLRKELKEITLKNNGSVCMGYHVRGFMDDVWLYKRALSNREVAETAGGAVPAKIKASAIAGDAPFKVEFTAEGADGECIWEFGDGETETGPKITHVYGRGGDYTAVLSVTSTNGSIAVARQKIDVKWKPADEAFAKLMNKVLDNARNNKEPVASQLSSPPNISSDDYMLMPPTTDPLGLKEPVWSAELSGSRVDNMVYAQPVVTKESIIFRHKNIVYCYSLLSGQLRWKNDVGGRMNWQNWNERSFPQEDILVQDGMVFTTINKVGPTLVALDEVTGQIKWAYGPMVATSQEEALLRFETAPAGGPRSVYAGYILDNIEGMTHTDTEYGIMAFESTTGRVLWRKELCRLRPGKFTAGFAVNRRNRIRSFISPPVYKEGTLYYCSNAGAIAALDGLSGQIKWVMRYPYYDKIHDAAQQFAQFGGPPGHGQIPIVYPTSPALWYNQKPLLIDDDLYVLPVDAPHMFKVDRRTGKVFWQKQKGEGIEGRRTDGGWTYFLGATADGDLAFSYSFRAFEKSWAGPQEGGGIHLVDPATGKTVWELGDWVKPIDHPFLTMSATEGGGADYAYESQRWQQAITARPFMSSDGKINLMSTHSQWWPHYGWEYNIAVIDLNKREIEAQRRYVSGEYIKQAEWSLNKAPDYLKRLSDVPHKDDRIKREMATLKAVIDRGTIPANEYGPFRPFSRITTERFGVPFEARMGPRTVALVYDKDKVAAALAGKSDTQSLFARAELAIADGRLTEASKLIQQCLALIPAEDADFRTMLNQQLYPIYKELARAGARAGNLDDYLKYCMGMSQTVGNLAEEMEALLALSEAYERKGDWQTAGLMAKSLASRFGQNEYATSALLQGDTTKAEEACVTVLDQVQEFTSNHMFTREIKAATTLMRKGLGLYFGALSPLTKDLRMRGGELGANRLVTLQKKFPALKQMLDQEAGAALSKQSADEQVARLWEYAGTETVQKLADRLVVDTANELKKEGLSLEDAASLRKRQWALADAARICGLKLSEEARQRLLAPPVKISGVAIKEVAKNRNVDLEETRGPAWLVLERGDQLDIEPDTVFLAARVKKKFDNKFLLYSFDLNTGKIGWKAQEQRGEQWFDEIRLAGVGDEPGFTEAFVYGDQVVVYGLYDVLSFNLKDGKLKWRYQVPFNFEIRNAIMSGDLLVLAGEAETLTLYLGTEDPRGEVVWQEKEEGTLYVAPYFVGDRFISIRKLPFSLTVRYRATGKLIGRLELPDLLLFDDNPLLENGPREMPVSHDKERLVVTDGRYYILLDVEKMKVIWKRLIDANDITRPPPLRFELNGDYLAVVKQDYDSKAIYMFSSRTGEILWQTDPKVPNSPQPFDTMLIKGDNIYGIKPHAGQGFYFVGLECATGKPIFKQNEQTGYGGKPEVNMRHVAYGDTVMVRIKDRQDFEVKAFSLSDGKLIHKQNAKSAGDFGEHGRASATAQNGRMVLLGKSDLVVPEGK